MTAPTTGTNAPRKTRDASGSANGIPMMAKPIPMPTRIDEGDQEGGAGIACERVEAGRARLANPRPGVGGHGAGDELPDVAAAE